MQPSCQAIKRVTRPVGGHPGPLVPSDFVSYSHASSPYFPTRCSHCWQILACKPIPLTPCHESNRLLSSVCFRDGSYKFEIYVPLPLFALYHHHLMAYCNRCQRSSRDYQAPRATQTRLQLPLDLRRLQLRLCSLKRATATLHTEH